MQAQGEPFPSFRLIHQAYLPQKLTEATFRLMSVATLVRLSLEAVAEDQKVVSDHRPQGNTDQEPI